MFCQPFAKCFAFPKCRASATLFNASHRLTRLLSGCQIKDLSVRYAHNAAIVVFRTQFIASSALNSSFTPANALLLVRLRKRELRSNSFSRLTGLASFRLLTATVQEASPSAHSRLTSSCKLLSLSLPSQSQIQSLHRLRM